VWCGVMWCYLTIVCWPCGFYSYGDIYDRTVHVQGTEIKAITYSNMQIHGVDGQDGVAGSATTSLETRGDGACVCCAGAGAAERHSGGRVDLFVIVDI
jgi:hypothetical protein